MPVGYSGTVPDEEIVKGYEYAKRHHLLKFTAGDRKLKLEAKHTIDRVRFVDEHKIDSGYLEKPYYLVPDGDEADEGYTVIRDALKETRKIAIGRFIMSGREHIGGIKAMASLPRRGRSFVGWRIGNDPAWITLLFVSWPMCRRRT